MEILVVRSCPGCDYCRPTVWSFWWAEDEPGVLGQALPADPHGDWFSSPVEDLEEVLWSLSLCPVSGESVPTTITPRG